MSLSAGTRLGSYEIRSVLGEGGMGVVYRARDSRLERDVALKVLPASVVADPERAARFEREAKLLAALNHPHIASVYGFEDGAGQRFIAMELVDGESLAERLRAGPLPVDEAVAIARQIGEALAAAHDKSIVHRDLKPANVMLAADGRVKVLDFGLAKMVDPGQGAAADASMSPTLSLQATLAGAILGTAAYMSPEQARGKAVDKRTDIWAFGCVLFEMCSARRPFHGEDLTETIAAVVRAEPDWTALPAATPPPVITIIKRCLAKDPRQRYADISVPLFLLDERNTASAVPAGGTHPRAGGWRSFAGWVAAAAALVALAAVIVLWSPWRPDAPAQPARFGIVLPPAAQFSVSVVDRQLDISPDGQRIVYVAGGPRPARLMLRNLNELEPRPLTGFMGARSPFFSPDGKWVAFFSGSELLKVAISGGPPVTLARLSTNTRGGTWSADGTIIIATSDRQTGLLSVSDRGGDAKPLTTLPDTRTDHLSPSALPDGRGVLYSIRLDDGVGPIAVRDGATGVSKDLVQSGDQAHYVASGHVVYSSANTLYAVAFDLDRLEVVGDPVALIGNISTKGTGATDFAVSKNGTLAYAPGGPDLDPQRSLVWVDRSGAETPLPAPRRSYFALRLSPDGTRAAVDVRDQERDIWVWDISRETLSRLSFGRGLDTFPVWSPDSRRIVYSRASRGTLLVRDADGTGQEQTLAEGDYVQFAQSFMPDGQRLLVTQQRSTNDLALLDTRDPAGSGTLVVDSAFVDGPGDVSPDGRWLAYQSNESGIDQIYVRALDTSAGGRVQVSQAGGTKPAWARNQRELFYLDVSGALMSVPVSTGGAFTSGPAVKISSTRYFSANQTRSYDVTPDGRRFLFIKDAAQNPSTTPASLIVTLNWFDEIRAKLPR
jgi:eukaryotic-like serine/threonine-protein kinase